MIVTKLKNGLNVIMYPIETSMSAEISMFIKAGSKYETERNNGITHLLEHMHFRQLGELSQDMIYYTTECMGSSLRGTTYKDMMHFFMKVRPQYTKESLSLFKKILVQSNWTDEQFQLEKKIVLNELNEKEDEVFLRSISDEAIWGNHPLSQQVLGSEEIIQKLSLEDIIQYKENAMCGDNIVLIITGRVDEEDIKESLEKIGEVPLHLSEQERIETSVKTQFTRKPKIHLEKFSSWNLCDVQISFDIPISEIFENEILFLNSVLGGGDGSILQKEIREKEGLVYDIYSDVDMYEEAAVLSIYFSVEREMLYETLEKVSGILKEINIIISQKDVDMNMTFFTENLWFWADDTHELNFQLGYDWIKGKNLLSIEERIERNRKINVLRLREIAEKIFKKENMTLIIMGPTGKVMKKRLQDIFL